MYLNLLAASKASFLSNFTARTIKRNRISAPQIGTAMVAARNQTSLALLSADPGAPID